MKKGNKIWLVISGILLIVLGVLCIAKPLNTLFATAWVIGILTLLSGIFKLIFTFRTQGFLPNSASRILSALLQIFIGCFFLFNILATAASLPFVFAFWIMMEGVIIAIQSFDYKKVGFPYWWAILLLGIAGAVLGFLGIRNPEAAGKTLSTLIGLGIIANGVAYLIGFAGLKRFEKQVKEMLEN